MGADLALNYAKRNSRELAGLILLALALNLDMQPVPQPGKLEPDAVFRARRTASR